MNVGDKILLDDDPNPWKIKQILKPNKFDCFLLISQKSKNTVHDDGTTPVYMSVIDVHNDIFYPATKKNLKLFKEIEKKEKKIKESKDGLTNEWLESAKDLGGPS